VSRQTEDAETERHRYVLARTYYTGEKWNEATKIFEKLTKDHPTNVEYKGYLGLLAVRQGDSDEVLRIAKELEQMDRPRMFGENLYWLASMAAVEGQKPRAIHLLREALAQGHSLLRPTLDYTDFSLHCEMNFESLRDDPDFQELIRPKG
jgi:tetratricopeptide (TPR) repeat protein